MEKSIIVSKLNPPTIPKDWNYDTSVKKTKQIIYKWKNLTEELAKELWIAREKLSAQGKRTDLTSGKNSRS